MEHNRFPDWSVDERSTNVDRNDTNAEHFEDADHTTQSFVRENTQNINDVIRTDVDAPARIRLFVSGENRAMQKATASKYFSHLAEHLDVCSFKAGLDSKVLEKDCQYLLIEDFNTTGLTGDVRKEHEPDGSGNNFYGFFRSVGKTSKTSGGGSWGVGKIVNNMASSISAFFGYSVRVAEQGEPVLFPRVLMGRATLTTHELNGKLYTPDAFFAIPESDEKNATPLPITDDSLLDEFVRDWRLSRRPNETGLSIVVPYCDKNIDTNAIPFHLVAETYGFVLNGRMTLEIDIPGLEESISADSLESFVEARTNVGNGQKDKHWNELLQRVRLAKWACDHQDADSVIELPAIESPMTAASYALTLSDELKTSIRTQFAEHGRVKLLARVTIEGKWNPLQLEPSPQSGALELVLGSVEGDDSLYPEYFRDWLRIGVGLKHRSNNERRMGKKIPRVQALLIVQGGKSNGLSVLLRASEGIAHSNWAGRSEGFKILFGKDGETWIGLAKGFPMVFADIAQGTDLEIDYSAFSFLADVDYPLKKERNSDNDKHRKKGDDDDPEVPTRTTTVRVSEINGGFSIALPKENPPSRFEVRTAYDVSRGNPFSLWSPADFEFKSLRIKPKGCVVAIRSGNLMEVTVKKPDEFALSVTGFDPNKDLVVKAYSPAAESAEETE